MANNADGKTNKNYLCKIVENIKSNKYLQYFIIIVLAIVCIFILFRGEETEKTSVSNQAEVYVDSLENRLEKTLSKVHGAGKVSVVITIESGMENVLATETVKKETSSGSETIETPIIVNGKTVVIKEAYPKITGVLIVAEGASNISVLTKIQQATVSLLKIEQDQIEILTMK